MHLNQLTFMAETLGCVIPTAGYLVIALIVGVHYSSAYIGATWGPAFVIWLLGKLPYRW